MANAEDRTGLADALRVQLVNRPAASREIFFDSTGRRVPSADPGESRTVYTATPLSFEGYTAVHRAMTEEELKRLKREQSRPVTDYGFFVIDLLHA